MTTELAGRLASPLTEWLGPNAPVVTRDAHRGGDSYEASMLRNLLARIHRDGGQRVDRRGLDIALEDAEVQVLLWIAMEERMADALEVLRQVGEHVSQYSDHTPDSFRRGLMSLMTPLHKVLRREKI